MASIKNRVIYTVAVNGRDKASFKRIVNVLAYRNAFQTTGPPAYGVAIAGPSLLSTFVANFATAWDALITTILNKNYIWDSIEAKEVVGWATGTDPRIVLLASNTSPVIVTTSGRHHLEAGDTVTIAGALGNTAVNGTFMVTPTGTDTFTVPIAGNGVYAGGGQWVKDNTRPRITYGDVSSIDGGGAHVGGNAGEAMPLHATLSVRKHTALPGRSRKGRMSMSMLTEGDNLNGRIIAITLPNFQTALTTLLTASLENGGTDATSKVMIPILFAPTIGFATVNPWSSSEVIAKDITSLEAVANEGSLVRRKPKLNSTILQ